MRRLALSSAHAGFPGHSECVLYGLPPVMSGAPTIARIAAPPRFPNLLGSAFGMRAYHLVVAVRIHIDTDFAGDPDDACALAIVLGSGEAEVIGITTSLEDNGYRGVALGWECVALQPTAVTATEQHGVVRFESSEPGAGAFTTSINATDFEERWLCHVEALAAARR
jgi:hypothetical protein